MARTEQFQTLTRDLAMQIVATSPLYVRREEVPAEIADKRRAVYREELVDSDKPADIIEKIVEGKLDKCISRKFACRAAFHQGRRCFGGRSGHRQYCQAWREHRGSARLHGSRVGE